AIGDCLLSHHILFSAGACFAISSLSLHGALPIYAWYALFAPSKTPRAVVTKLNAEVNRILRQPDTRQRLDAIDLGVELRHDRSRDRKSTRLNSSHSHNSYAVFCVKKNTITRK